jgi:hypothetical protein
LSEQDRRAGGVRDNYSRRGAVGGRAGARNGTGHAWPVGERELPERPNGFDPSYNWNNGVPAYPQPPFFDPTLNTASSPAGAPAVV